VCAGLSLVHAWAYPCAAAVQCLAARSGTMHRDSAGKPAC